ncbi:PadR family transcriptional regulator [Cellulomonas fimi]|uniref:Transcriptional regulator, PadR-like family n=1 Tax=Cellulomonas fimi (strain ATCC 484 / DSM 20113 / JCM 1341 / CCUG 24087 / LMG 16345 / NBRC 15513 / NCIMB 8980 / NCTC 7547 / NRS-133) TaxID=590998 RepID=F4H5D0_CELFA|nr:PadR family transcriptional regulator [Cellulomonas fimi]AEE47853.1 transcriptional regulator, PadR-like family [Cellulomonas fimi ATCC 484]NNH06009.1 PadR family transcriptional regulator [Cellulomonas fimi]
MAPRTRSNPLALAVLTLLWERPMHPYEMSMTLRERRKDETVRLNFGSLYSVVDGLEKRGLIEAASTEREGNRPPRTVYRITDAGATEAVDWLSDLVRTPVKEFPQFEAALSFLPLLAPDDVARLLRMRAASVRVTLTSLESTVADARAQGLPRIFALEAEYEMALLRAELDFVVALEAGIGDGSLEQVDLWRSLHDRADAAGRLDPDELADALAPYLSVQEDPPTTR